ncbi:MAG: hypothetical protein Rhob2KO_49380 [Rhodopirellula baltica]|uniref:Uncharacterized protein n=2 Tax=Rhodopirellula bahusiensis TaxID=2014065 RepID=A0A2G1W2B8_9BACT|nr:hypothetical protein CEE69_22205 [Rhodopirellula bahusiensis]
MDFCLSNEGDQQKELVSQADVEKALARKSVPEFSGAFGRLKICIAMAEHLRLNDGELVQMKNLLSGLHVTNEDLELVNLQGAMNASEKEAELRLQSLRSLMQVRFEEADEELASLLGERRRREVVGVQAYLLGCAILTDRVLVEAIEIEPEQLVEIRKSRSAHQNRWKEIDDSDFVSMTLELETWEREVRKVLAPLQRNRFDSLVSIGRTLLHPKNKEDKAVSH